jgi:hypothetical protein
MMVALIEQTKEAIQTLKGAFDFEILLDVLQLSKSYFPKHADSEVTNNCFS